MMNVSRTCLVSKIPFSTPDVAILDMQTHVILHITCNLTSLLRRLRTGTVPGEMDVNESVVLTAAERRNFILRKNGVSDQIIWPLSLLQSDADILHAANIKDLITAVERF